MEAKGSVPGIHNQHHVLFYALSTCIWCKRVRQFLESKSVAFDFVYVDLLSGAEQNAAVEQVRRWNPSVSFPTLIIDGKRCIVGYRPEEIQEALGL
ncbi:MAG: glutaredoxin family protein [Anaerolineae bacterium]|nr:glutaredoxin family protein [Anaerolineae bacterium]MDW7991588.1 glutaredoxin family protein [Anaerolineae bacterium]